ncbi:ATP-dependent caseinolytic (Clp) protease/crotonase family protein [Actinidia rufa]|uniref:ATP-dependent caseinolytic (Clp) protease/crotonase family protein n=1 Tax=Actinidia rufa TaxID=165716 RepID=A0A7J0EWG9_9ERIC|nr:ATP-dependent caseinolytic (Clp) protease/crotonase family protein [Actinidia rufa]
MNGLVANESEGFAIYDVLMSLKTEIRTVALGTATGQACLLLAAGTKGRRAYLSFIPVMIQEPRVAPSGSLSASDVAIRAKEILWRGQEYLKDVYLPEEEESDTSAVTDGIGAV